MLRLGLRRRAAIDRAGIAFVTENHGRQQQISPHSPGHASGGRRQPHPLDEPPPRKTVAIDRQEVAWDECLLKAAPCVGSVWLRLSRCQ